MIIFRTLSHPKISEKSKDNLRIIAQTLKTERPSFELHMAEIGSIHSVVKKYKKFKKVILIGNGGSRTSAYAWYHALDTYRNRVSFEFISTAEPHVILSVKKRCPKKETLVVVVSKSGDNINALEPLLSFLDYSVLAVTQSGFESPLEHIARKKRWEIVEHPAVGGRFSGLTASGLVPAALMGLDIEALLRGAKSGYKKYGSQAKPSQNDALFLSRALYDLENMGWVEIFSSFYSSQLFGFLPLIVQLIHESNGKDGKGQTIFGDQAPESQHHTNQRLFGGRKNIIGLFFGVENFEKQISLKIPSEFRSIPLRSKTLGDLKGINLADTLAYDRKGVIQHCHERGIPAFELLVDRITPEAMGEFMVFWQYVAVYSAILRGQNPYDQPEVERSKEISFDLRVGR